jgi:hypothetical protein
VVDLPLLRRACGPLIGCYERFLSESSVDLHDVDDALASLRVLPPLEGRLGRAVALVTSGGAGAPTEQTLAALELLRSTTGLRPAPEVAVSSCHHEPSCQGGWTHSALPAWHELTR